MLYIAHGVEPFNNKVDDTINNCIVGTLKDAITCTIEEDITGTFSLSMTYPVDGENADLLIFGNSILAPMVHREHLQIFIISAVNFSENADGAELTVEANHISYNLNYYAIPTFNLNSTRSLYIASQAVALGQAVNGSDVGDFTFAGNITVNKASYGDVVSLREMFYNMIENRDCYIEVDNLAHTFKTFDDTAKDYELRYGKNILEFQSDYATDDFFTHILPYAIGYDGRFLCDRNAIKRPGVNDFMSGYFSTAKIVKAINLTGKYGLTDSEDHPMDIMNIVDAADIWMSENPFSPFPERISVKALPEDGNNFFIGAHGLIVYPQMNLNYETAITSLVYDVLEERVTDIGVGKAKNTMASVVADLAAERKY